MMYAILRRGWMLLLLLAWPFGAAPVAQILDTGAISVVSSGGACTAAPLGCATFSLGNAAIASVTLQVNGTFTGTLLFEATSDNTNWFTITGIKLLDGSTSTGFASVGGTNTGQFAFRNSGLLAIRVRSTAWTSGTALITAVRGYASALGLSPFLSSLTISQGTLTADAQAISTSATWNSAGTTFTHWKAVITDTASAATSKAINILGGAAGATTLFSVSNTGAAVFGDSLTIIAGSFRWSGSSRIKSTSDGIITLLNNAESDFSRLQLGGTTSSFVAAKRVGTALYLRLADDSAAGGLGFASLAVSGTAPTISSGFGTSPSIVASNGTAAFTINVGTGGTAQTGVIGLPTATTGWRVTCDNTSANTATVFITKQTAFTTTSATIGNYDAAGAAAAWTASNVLVCGATAF